MPWPPVPQHLNQSETIGAYRQPVIASDAANIAASLRVPTTHVTREAHGQSLCCR